MADEPPPLSEADRLLAGVLAMSVRNALEGTLHGGDLGELALTDEQMSVLNPVVRDAVATGLHAWSNFHWCGPARAYFAFQAKLIPDYWESAELLSDYVDDWPLLAERDDGYERTCRRCGRRIVNPGAGWTHLGADNTLVVGCRAASFTSEGGWDDTLDRRWHAAPIEQGDGRSDP